MIVPKQCKFEAIFCGIERDGTGTGGAVKTMHSLAFDACKVDRVVKRANDTMIAAAANDQWSEVEHG
jgi:hypothetical protein